MEQDGDWTSNPKTMTHCTVVSADPNGSVLNGCDSAKVVSLDGSDKTDVMSPYSSSSSFVPSTDKEPEPELVFQNLVEMYQLQLKSIDDLDWDDNRKFQKKIKILEDFVDQLLEQNEVLVSTAVELEREAKKRVHQMESRLKKSAKSTKEVVLCLHDYEQHMQELITVKAQIEAELEDMRQNNSTVKVENGFLRDQNANLRHDLHALLHVMQQARSTGNWEMDWITFCELSPEQVFGPISSFSRVHSGESLAQTPEDLPYRGYCSSDRGSWGTSHYSSFTNLQDPEQGMVRKYEPDSLSRLQMENRQLQKLREQSQMELLEKDKIIANLESQITCLNQEIAVHRLESDRQLLIYRAQSLEDAARPIFSPYPGLPVNHGHSLPYLCHHGSCSNCGMPLSQEEDQRSSGATKRKDCSTFGGFHHHLSKKGQNGSGDATSSHTAEHSNSFSFATKEQQHISSLFESTYVQTEECAHEDIGIQADVKTTSVFVQTETAKKSVEALIEETNDETYRRNMESVKEHLRRAEDKATSKEMLISQLQSHLQTSVREVELKDTALENLERKLDSSRAECTRLKESIAELNNSILGLQQELQYSLDVQKNLSGNVQAREEMVQEWKILEQTLQDQKRRLMTQVDEQGDEILRLENELQTLKAELNLCRTEAELQKLTIQNLQEALITSKALTESSKEPPTNQNSISQHNVARRALSQNSVFDI